jgi:hypothetical protein
MRQLLPLALVLIFTGCASETSPKAIVKHDGLHRQIHLSDMKGGKALVTKELYVAIKPGMSQAEVIKLIAAPEKNRVKLHSAKDGEVHYIELNEEGRKIILKYKGDALTDKDQIGVE